jgi:hypothetical protein
MFEIPPEDFHDIVGEPERSALYSRITLTGPDVNIQCMPEDKTFKVSGTYGNPETRKKTSHGGMRDSSSSNEERRHVVDTTRAEAKWKC